MLFFLLTILVIIAVLGVAYYKHSKNQKDNRDVALPDEDEWLGNSTVFRTDIKMMTYNDALEESKQFIYNIAKIVMQRFAPDQKNSVLNWGRKLLQAGVKYVHIVDIFALSLERKISRFKNNSNNNSKQSIKR